MFLTFDLRVDALMEAFSRLPQRFIVKFDVEVERPPPNVLIVKTILPQQVINLIHYFLDRFGQQYFV